MSSREFKRRVQDILSEISFIERSIEGFSFEIFIEDEQALRAILYSLAVIGEGVGSVINDLKLANPTMPWTEIRGMRNAIVHEYFQVDVELIWETIQTDLPTLKIALQRILISLESEPN